MGRNTTHPTHKATEFTRPAPSSFASRAASFPGQGGRTSTIDRARPNFIRKGRRACAADLPLTATRRGGGGAAEPGRDTTIRGRLQINRVGYGAVHYDGMVHVHVRQ